MLAFQLLAESAKRRAVGPSATRGEDRNASKRRKFDTTAADEIVIDALVGPGIAPDILLPAAYGPAAVTRAAATYSFYHDRGALGMSQDPCGMWGFNRELTERFPALLKKNFFCVQQHQATALHYDLRLQVDGGLFSWAIPKGFIGVGEDNRAHLAVETTVHAIAYATVEAADGRTLRPSNVKCGTLLWDIGEYHINLDTAQAGGQSPMSSDEEDSQGAYEERKLAHALDLAQQTGRRGKTKRSIYITLSGGHKLRNNSYVLRETDAEYNSRGDKKTSWLLRLQPRLRPYVFNDDADLSILTNRTLLQVCEQENRKPLEATTGRRTYADSELG